MIWTTLSHLLPGFLLGKKLHGNTTRNGAVLPRGCGQCEVLLTDEEGGGLFGLSEVIDSCVGTGLLWNVDSMVSLPVS